MFDIKGPGHFARRWLREVGLHEHETRGTARPRSYWRLRLEDIFFFVLGGIRGVAELIGRQAVVFVFEHAQSRDFASDFATETLLAIGMRTTEVWSIVIENDINVGTERGEDERKLL